MKVAALLLFYFVRLPFWLQNYSNTYKQQNVIHIYIVFCSLN
jgi:hypothetical protein